MPSEQKREGGWPKSHFEQNKFDDKKTVVATFQKKKIMRYRLSDHAAQMRTKHFGRLPMVWNIFLFQKLIQRVNMGHELFMYWLDDKKSCYGITSVSYSSKKSMAVDKRGLWKKEKDRFATANLEFRIKRFFEGKKWWVNFCGAREDGINEIPKRNERLYFLHKNPIPNRFFFFPW